MVQAKGFTNLTLFTGLHGKVKLKRVTITKNYGLKILCIYNSERFLELGLLIMLNYYLPSLRKPYKPRRRDNLNPYFLLSLNLHD